MKKELEQGIPYMVNTFQSIMNKQKEFDYPTNKIGGVKYTFSRKNDIRKEEYRTILKEMLNFDTILSPEETISLGFADEIYLPL